MLILLPFVIIGLIIFAIDFIYFSDVKPVNTNTKEVRIEDKNVSNTYLDKYIKK